MCNHQLCNHQMCNHQMYNHQLLNQKRKHSLLHPECNHHHTQIYSKDLNNNKIKYSWMTISLSSCTTLIKELTNLWCNITQCHSNKFNTQHSRDINMYCHSSSNKWCISNINRSYHNTSSNSMITTNQLNIKSNNFKNNNVNCNKNCNKNSKSNSTSNKNWKN